MKILKKIIFYIILIMTFALSFSAEDAKIYVDRKTEPAKLKIGVTKLKTKELNLDFNAEEKTIFGYLPDSVTDNHLIFVSETLDEMPSLSTTNGRRSINNIKKYLTKNIKVAPKFTYQVLVGDKENGVEEGKRYLLMNCKTVLSGVYVYVVEKDTYHVKEVYKGKFNVPTTLEERTTYGTIHFNANHPLDGNGTLIYESGIIKYQGTNISTGENATVKLEGTGIFPKRLAISTEKADEYYDRIGGFRASPTVWILIDDKVIETYELNPYSGMFSMNSIDIMDINGNKAGTIKIIPEENKEFLKIEFSDWNKFAEVERKIGIKYGRKNSLYEKVHVKENFTLKIDKKPSMAFLGTTGEVSFTEKHTLNKSKNQILTYAKTEGKNDKVKLDDEIKDFIYFKGQFPKKIQGNDQGVNWYQEQKVIIESKSTKVEVPFNKETGEFSTNFSLKGVIVTDVAHIVTNDIKIFADETSEYLKIQFLNWNKYLSISEEIKIKYVGKEKKDGTYVDHILKEDVLNININANKLEELKGNTGSLAIYDGNETLNLILTSNASGLNVVSSKSGFNKNSQTYFEGKFPAKVTFADNQDGSWGRKQKVVLYDMVGRKKISEESTDYTGKFNMDGEDHLGVIDRWPQWINFNVFSGGRSNVGRMRLYADNYDLIKIEFGRFWGEYKPKEDLDVGAGNVNITFLLEYQIDIGNQEEIWVTKSKNYFTLMIGKEYAPETPGKIKPKNPLVFYDYYSMNPFNHNKRAHLSANKVETIDRDGKVFLKNTNYNGEQWISKDGTTENLVNYDWKKLGKHRIEFSSTRNGDYGQVIKNTDINGKTQSSTFIDLDGGNQVVFSYDGGNEFLNFGVSKYNFKGGNGEVTIKQYSSTTSSGIGTPVEVKNYIIELPKFDGRPYVSNQYDIKPFYDNVKYYKFNQDIGTGKVIIPYGTVGFKDLDTRITEQSGGEGIELRVIKDVYLESMFYNDSNREPYRIEGELYFRREGSKIFDDTLSNGTKVSRFKGENEKSTSAMVYLVLDSQESLIPGGEYKIVKRNKNTTKLISEDTPIEVGVVVDGDDTTYFSGVGDLYISLEDKRFVDTKLIFDNEKINIQTGNIVGVPLEDDSVWIKLNKSQYPTGIVGKDYIGQKWGSVKGEVVDVPLKYQNGESIATKIEVLDSNYKLLQQDYNNKDGGIIELGQNKIYLKYNSGNNYISFKLLPTKNDETIPSYIQQLKEEIFYIRYYDGNRVSGEKIEPNAFLFTQRIKVVFDKPRALTGDTRIEILNPAMAFESKNLTKGLLYINDDEYKGGKVDYFNDNSKLPDAEIWWEIFGEANYKNFHFDLYPKFDVTQGNTNITPDKDGIYILDNKKVGIYLDSKDISQNKRLAIGVNKIDGYKGEKIDSEFYLEWTADGDPTGIILGKGRRDKINLSIEALDTTYYGLITKDSVKMETDYSKINYVGMGKHQLKPLLSGEEYVDIDLETYFREYTRNRGILNLINGVGSSNLRLKVENNVKVIPKQDEVIPVPLVSKNNENNIVGEIKFFDSTGKEVSIIEIKNETDISKIEMYKIKLRLSAKEYNKLEGNKQYEIYGVNGKDIFTIDFENKNLLSETVNKKIRLDKPLNFITSEDYFWIEEAILDFGEISLGNSTKEITKSTNVIVHSKYDYNLFVEPTIQITKINSEGNYDENHKLIVSNIAIEDTLSKDINYKLQELEEKNSIKTHLLTGTLKVPAIDVELGEYRGYIIINVTLEN